MGRLPIDLVGLIPDFKTSRSPTFFKIRQTKSGSWEMGGLALTTASDRGDLGHNVHAEAVFWDFCRIFDSMHVPVVT